MARRNIDAIEIDKVLNSPESELQVREGRSVYQARIKDGEGGKIFLLRVFVDTDRTIPEVVTAYRTSKIEKYLR